MNPDAPMPGHLLLGIHSSAALAIVELRMLLVTGYATTLLSVPAG
jgi:hypothetical protein